MVSKEILNIAELLTFLDTSPTAWHAVNNCSKELLEYEFVELKEENTWTIRPGGHYFVTRNGSSLCAFIVPKKAPIALRVAASHTDSPTLKLKPNAEFYKENMLMLGLEVYGGPLLSSWLNRDLGIAGRVIFKDKKDCIREELVRLDTSPVVIPQLAIHLDRNVNDTGLILNKQDHLAALVSTHDKSKDKSTFLERSLKKILPLKEILSTELFVFPLESSNLFGEENQLISSYRIDSLASVHAALKGLLNTIKPSDHLIKMIAFWDNEEIGSHTAQGAGSPFLMNIMERLTIALKLSREEYLRMITRSLCASVDLSHAMHPNYSDRHEPHHATLLNKGIVIKTNAQHRYASDARSTATIVELCHEHHIPFQHYVSKGDIPCGSTIGPVHANLTGMPTIDIGCPQLSMHSTREIMGTADQLSMCRLLTAFLSYPPPYSMLS